MKIDLKDVTFIIPIRLDSIIRLENLLAVTRFLIRNFETNITVIEASDYNNGLLKRLLNKRINYIYYEDKDPVFYRTKYLNIATKQSTTPRIAVWDSDVVIPKEQIFKAVFKLRKDFDVAYPYDGNFYDTSDIIREHYIQNNSIQILQKNKRKLNKIYGDNLKGGAFIINRDAYIKGGMENENFYGWASEDFDRYEKWIALDFKIFRSQGCLFHLTHPRGINSKFRSNEQRNYTDRLLFLTARSSKEEITKQ